MKQNLKTRMQDGQHVFGTWSMLPSSTVVDVIARSGIDFIVIDLEHGLISWETAEEMVRAALLQDCQPIIRVGDKHENTILRALETNCRAILVPHVSTESEAIKIVRAARYSPLGDRGLSPYTSCHNFHHEGLHQSLAYHAENTLVGILVEGEEGIQNLHDISAVPGIDLIYLGLYDISQSIGLSGQLEHPRVREKMIECLKIIKGNQKLVGTFAREVGACREFSQMGFSFIAYVADSFALADFYRKFNAIVKNDGL